MNGFARRPLYADDTPPAEKLQAFCRIPYICTACGKEENLWNKRHWFAPVDIPCTCGSQLDGQSTMRKVPKNVYHSLGRQPTSRYDNPFYPERIMAALPDNYRVIIPLTHDRLPAYTRKLVADNWGFFSKSFASQEEAFVKLRDDAKETILTLYDWEIMTVQEIREWHYSRWLRGY